MGPRRDRAIPPAQSRSHRRRSQQRRGYGRGHHSDYRPNVSYAAVRASRGKVIRAEPVAALYEQRRIHHVGAFPTLEDQMCAFAPDFDRTTAGYSPDRVDGLVGAFADLLVDQMSNKGFFEWAGQKAPQLRRK